MKLYKYLKYSSYILILITFMVFLSGCHAMYPITVTISGENMSDKKIDILIPMDKYSPDYRDSTYEGENVIKKSNPEIASYNVDGYRSMLCHYGLEDYKIKKTDNSTYTAELYLNGKYEFKQLCDNYETFKIAVLDNDGNILKVSEEYRFRLRENVILDKIEYDYVTNTVHPEYIYNRSLVVVLAEFLVELLIMVMPIPSIICFIVFILQKLKGSLDFPTIYHNIMFMIYILPVALFLGLRTDYAIKTENSLSSVWEDFLNLGNIFTVMYCLIPVIIFLVVFIWWLISLFSGDNDSACNFSGDDV
ncbi:MAG: hypothetical protein NC040_09745 [Muribaculaceae bacterium]|nr:hypothetical protein [Alistipes senegalensis]MCM1474330.1 hypothetical protein [Muribaculaceae bacterium]